MKPWVLVDTAETADGKTISLLEHDGTRVIRVDGLELMSTRRHLSEEKLAQLACAHLADKRNARVLIGGLGFGFTLDAALAITPPDTHVVVAELLEAVVRWNARPSVDRVSIVQRDVVEVINESKAAYDSIILDVDNGPEALTSSGNERLYHDTGLLATKNALKPGGCAAWWSAAANPAFAKRVAHAGFQSETHRAGGHTILLGRKR